MKQWWLIVQITAALTYNTTGFACFYFQVKNLYSINTWQRLRHTYVLSLLVLRTTFIYLYKGNLQILLLCYIYILRWWPFLHSFYTLFQNSSYGHGTDTFSTSFLFFRVSFCNFLCYLSKEFNFPISKTPPMKLEKMLKIIYQKRNYLISFCSVY